LALHHLGSNARTIKFLVAYAPGGGVNVLARLLAEQIARTRGVTTVVENRPGAAGLIAADAVLRAPPDGNTLLFTSSDPLVVTPHFRKLAYDPLVSFEPICKLVDTPSVVLVNNTSPYHSIAEFIDGARSKPGDFTVASVGPGGAYHIAVEMLKRTAGAGLTYVPYSSSAPAIGALLGGHVTAVLAAYPTGAEQL
jgi:tripartite-type tricarboxylate transporter receptor subunit TctC